MSVISNLGFVTMVIARNCEVNESELCKSRRKEKHRRASREWGTVWSEIMVSRGEWKNCNDDDYEHEYDGAKEGVLFIEEGEDGGQCENKNGVIC